MYMYLSIANPASQQAFAEHPQECKNHRTCKRPRHPSAPNVYMTHIWRQIKPSKSKKPLQKNSHTHRPRSKLAVKIH